MSTLQEWPRQFSSTNASVQVSTTWKYNGVSHQATHAQKRFLWNSLGEVWAFPVLVLLNLVQTFWRSLHLLVGRALKRKTCCLCYTVSGF